jgi:hypothetical protein
MPRAQAAICWVKTQGRSARCLAMMVWYKGEKPDHQRLRVDRYKHKQEQRKDAPEDAANDSKTRFGALLMQPKAILNLAAEVRNDL